MTEPYTLLKPSASTNKQLRELGKPTRNIQSSSSCLGFVVADGKVGADLTKMLERYLNFFPFHRARSGSTLP